MRPAAPLFYRSFALWMLPVALVVAHCDPVLDGTASPDGTLAPDGAPSPPPDVATCAPYCNDAALLIDGGADVGQRPDGRPIRPAADATAVSVEDAESRPNSDAGARPQSDARPDSDSDSDSDSDAGATPDSDAGARPTPDSDAGPTPDSDAGARPDSDAGPRPDSDARPTPDSDARAAPDSDAGPAPDSDAETQSIIDAGIASHLDDAAPRLSDAAHADPPDSDRVCPDEILSAELVERRPYVRDEPAEIRYSAAAGYTVDAESPAGGHLAARAGRYFYTARGGELGDLAWPHWTGEVTVRLTATHPELDCEAVVDVGVPVAGDVLQGDAHGGRIVVYGSDGGFLGDLPPVNERGVLSIVVVPPAEGFAGGLAVLIWRSDGTPAEIRLLDRQGGVLPVAFDTQEINGDLIYRIGRAPHQLFVRDGMLWADLGSRCRVHRWNLQGTYLDAVTYPCDHPESTRMVGFGVLDGDVLVGRYTGATRLYDAEGNLRLDVPSFGALRGVVCGHEGDIVVFTSGSESRIWLYNAQGRLLVEEPTRNGHHPYMVSFLDHYLVREPEIGLYLRHRDLSPVVPHEAWNHGLQGLWWDNGGLAWLDDGTWQ